MHLGKPFCGRTSNTEELAANAEQHGWRTKVYTTPPVEVGCRGVVRKSTTRLPRDLGIRGQALRHAIKSLSNSAEQSSHWLWLKRRDSTWAAKQQQEQQRGSHLGRQVVPMGPLEVSGASHTDDGGCPPDDLHDARSPLHPT